MPEFDESFLSACALAESQNFISYSLDRRSVLNKRRRKLKSSKYCEPGIVVKNVVHYNVITSPSTTGSGGGGGSAAAYHHGCHTIGHLSTISSPQTPIAPLNRTVNASTIGSSGHKNSLKGTKLARRARSFKDDLFEKISLMRTPTNTLGRAHSPHSPRNKSISSKPPPTAEEVAKSSQSLETHVKDISNALKHFRDVILKKKLEVLPGNGTVILETIASMYAVIQSYMLNENSTVMLSATQQVYQSLGKLIKLCDEVMLSDETSECASLSNDNVKEVVDLLEDAVKNLVSLAQQKLKEKEESAFKYGPSTPETPATSNNLLMRPPVEVAGQRTSLPDITLTPKERDILEKTKSNPIRASHSTESILRDTSPPPKPPLPNRSTHPPPLPPKRRNQPPNVNNISINSDLDCSSDFSLLNYGVDHLSVRSRSPDENSSQCSLDSALNHSREEDELKALVMENRHGDNVLDDSVEKMFAFSFVSMKSFRTSTLSVSKRSSEYSFQSSTKSSNADLNYTRNSSDAAAFGTFEVANQELHPTAAADSTISDFEQQFAGSNAAIVSASTTSANTANSMHFTKIGSATSGITQSNHITDNHLDSNASSVSPDTFEQEASSSFRRFADASSLTKAGSLDVASTDDIQTETVNLMPPALPPKTKCKERQLSQYDNFDEFDNIGSLNSHDLPQLRHHHHHQQMSSFQWQSRHESLIERRMGGLAGSCNAIGVDGNLDEPPPLPMKKKHILAYMEICSASTRSIEQHRHTMHAYNLNRNITHSQTMNIVPAAKDLNTPENEVPPALPPKNSKPRRPSMNPTPPPPTIITTPPPSPKPSQLVAESYIESGGMGRHNRLLPAQGTELMSTVCEEMADLSEEEQAVHCTSMPTDSAAVKSSLDDAATASAPATDLINEVDEGIDIVLEKNNYNNNKDCSPTKLLAKDTLPNLLEEIDITPYLILKKDSEDGPDVKGGYIDALIVHASRVQKISDNAFSEAFITTFRTFIQPIDVIEKLTHRYTVFFCQLNDQKQKAAKETFSLLVRVVNDLTSTDLTSQLLTLLVEFVYQLVCSGQLYLAKLLRNKIVEKVTTYKEQKLPTFPTTMHFTTTNQPSLLDLKSVEIAEQMTLLDAELFQKIEIPEVLLFAKEQCEERSPNLNKFTEHFNKMSYWARSKILMLPDAKEREKHVIKFIKIMKHLRKMNNYNSYLALLSALDSAPIRRLEWHKTITEGLKEYCTLIDSSSSFRVYRQALAETNPPCIPYIGLVLQDLTFVHVGNPDYLKDGVINFSKRWQQHNIIVNMKRFKKCSYPFRRIDRIIRFFENFENFLGEEEMWQISEAIKPRGRRPAHN